MSNTNATRVTLSTARYVCASLGGWLIVAFLFAGELIAYGRWPIRAAAELAVLTVIPACVLSFPVWKLTNRVPWSRLPSPGALAVHAGTAVMFGVLLVSMEVALASALQSTEALRFLVSSMGLGTLMGTAMYGLIAGASYAIRSQATLESERAELNAHRANAAEAKSALSAADLATLRARLNPHFLFNALHSISALVRINPAEADVAIEELGQMLRTITSDASTEAATLDDEVDLARTYLLFERRRLHDRLDVVVEVEESSGETMVPRLLLQPLVENAIRHGIEPLRRPATVTVRARLKGTELEILVADDGAGCDVIDWGGRGNGLVALRRRLVALYQDRASIEVTTASGAGFLVAIKIPAA